ncbi:MAG: aspartate kinase [Candidatus Oxydemutatoraceae bacterium WSBS_2016_MAG_OTU14]
MDNLVVHKYGGSSVGDIERIQHVARKIQKAREEGDQVVAVVSAMSGETDRLLDFACAIDEQYRGRELDALVATGEQASCALLAMALETIGTPAISLTGAQAHIYSDQNYTKARIQAIDESIVLKHLSAGKVVIITGFQGVDSDGNTTTFGRGGSDTSAVAIAAKLKARECQIYTDVNGVYTTDPRIVPTARLLEKITFEEMLEMASLGSKVLQIRAVEFAGKYNVPLRVLSSFKEGEGTLIVYEDKSLEKVKVSGIAFNRDEAQLTITGVPDMPGIAAEILGPVADANVEVDMIVQNVSAKNNRADFTFTVHRRDYQLTLDLLERLGKQMNVERVFGNNKIVKVSLVGVGMRSHAGVAAMMFRELASAKINIHMITTSEIKISVVVDEDKLEQAVQVLHDAFDLDKEPSSSVE